MIHHIYNNAPIYYSLCRGTSPKFTESEELSEKYQKKSTSNQVPFLFTQYMMKSVSVHISP